MEIYEKCYHRSCSTGKLFDGLDQIGDHIKRFKEAIYKEIYNRKGNYQNSHLQFIDHHTNIW